MAVEQPVVRCRAHVLQLHFDQQRDPRLAELGEMEGRRKQLRLEPFRIDIVQALPYLHGDPLDPRPTCPSPTAGRSRRTWLLRCKPVTASFSLNSRPFSARSAVRYRVYCFLRYFRRSSIVISSSSFLLPSPR